MGSFVNIRMRGRFQKVRTKVERWNSVGKRYFPNVFSRSLTVKTYLVSQFQYFLSNATLRKKKIN